MIRKQSILVIILKEITGNLTPKAVVIRIARGTKTKRIKSFGHLVVILEKLLPALITRIVCVGNTVVIKGLLDV
jgi:hypothetical protein